MPMTAGAPRPLRLEGFVTSGLLPIAGARMIDPLRIAAKRPGVTARVHVETATVVPPMAGADTVFLRYRPHGRPVSWPLHRAVLQAGYLLVSDVDDLMWRESGAVNDADLEQRLRGYRDSDYVALRGVHAVQVSTPALLEEVRRFNPAVRVFPAALADIPAFRARPKRTPRLIFAALNRAADWQPILEPLNRVLARRPDVLVATLHDAAFHDALATANKRLFEFQPYGQYLHTLGECDVALLPLADTPFNRAKSDLKFVECASRGTAVLASATVYGDCVEDGVSGLLYRTPAEFETRLERLLADADLRSSLARAAHAWALRHRRLEDGVDARLSWYRDLLADKPRLDAGIRERAGWILDPEGTPGSAPEPPGG